MQVTLSPLAWMRSPWERVSHSTLEGPSWVSALPGALRSLGKTALSKGDKSSGLQELTFLWGRLTLNNQVLECSAEVISGWSFEDVCLVVLRRQTCPYPPVQRGLNPFLGEDGGSQEDPSEGRRPGVGRRGGAGSPSTGFTAPLGAVFLQRCESHRLCRLSPPCGRGEGGRHGDRQGPGWPR